MKKWLGTFACLIEIGWTIQADCPKTFSTHLTTMTMTRILAFGPIVVLFTVLGAVASMAQTMKTDNTLALDDPSNMPSATVDDVGWMAGHWKTAAFGGEVEEIWSPPFGDSMMGMFKIVRDGASTLYEFFSLVEENGSLVIKLKHFNADMSGWEDVGQFMPFPLVRLEPDAAYFDGLTYRRVDPETMRVHLALQEGDEIIETTFDYKLVASPEHMPTTDPAKSLRYE